MAEVPVVELPPVEVAAPVEEAVTAEEIPDWLKDLGMAKVEETAAPVTEVPVVELVPPEAAAPMPEEAVPEIQVPESLKALVEAGMLDEADLAAAMAADDA